MTIITLFHSIGCQTTWFTGQEKSGLENINGKVHGNTLRFCPWTLENFTAVNDKPQCGRQAIFNDDGHS